MVFGSAQAPTFVRRRERAGRLVMQFTKQWALPRFLIWRRDHALMVALQQ
jgi:hypothetical protein